LLRGHFGGVKALTWAPDGKRLASGDVGGMVRVWNVETGTVEWSAIRLRGDRSVVFSPTGEILYGHPKVIEEDLIYLLEPPGGPIELLKPSEFNKRAGR
jgi:WD40 repeat protein